MLVTWGTKPMEDLLSELALGLESHFIYAYIKMFSMGRPIINQTKLKCTKFDDLLAFSLVRSRKRVF